MHHVGEAGRNRVFFLLLLLPVRAQLGVRTSCQIRD